MKNTTLKMIAITGLFLVSFNSVAGNVAGYYHDFDEYYTQYHKDIKHCVSITSEATHQYGGGTELHIVNDCGFDIEVFYCSPDADGREDIAGPITTTFSKCDIDGVHFSQVTSVSQVESAWTSVNAAYSLEWFACGAKGYTFSNSHWAIKGNTPYSDSFSCYTNKRR